MTYSINFPNLGIHLEHVPKTLTIFGFGVAYYGICIAIGMLVAFAVIDRQAKRHLANPDDAFYMTILAIIVGIICARIYYVAFSWDYYKADPISVFKIREGGLAIYGGLIGGAISVIVYSVKKKINVLDSFDVLFPGVVIGQVIGRWGNFFNREAFSEYTNGLFAMQIPVDAVRQGEITDKMWLHLTNIGGVDYIQVAPNFLYEGIGNLCLFVILLILSKHRIFKGEILLAYVMGYGSLRCILESFRTDQLTIGNTHFAISQILGGASALVAAVVFSCKLYSFLLKKMIVVSAPVGDPAPEVEDKRGNAE